MLKHSPMSRARTREYAHTHKQSIEASLRRLFKRISMFQLIQVVTFSLYSFSDTCLFVCVHLSLVPSVSLFVFHCHSDICQSVCQTVCLCLSLSVRQSVRLSVCLSVTLSLSLSLTLSLSHFPPHTPGTSVCLSVCLSVCQTVCLSNCLSVTHTHTLTHTHFTHTHTHTFTTHTHTHTLSRTHNSYINAPAPISALSTVFDCMASCSHVV